MRLSTWALVVFVCAGLFGCGGSSSSPPPASSSSTTTADTPLKGKDLGKSSQLVGTWLAQTEGDFLGFEFMKDGKVLATHAMQAALMGTGSGVMLTYSVLDGGRLSLTAPDGQTQVFSTTISGDTMELTGTMVFSGAGSQRFRKLKAGQTLEQAIEEQAAEQAKIATERFNTVQAYMKQPGLVIVCTNNTPGQPVSIAIAPPDEKGAQQAYHDDQPPHLDQIYLAADIGQSAEKAVLNVTFGQQLVPAPTQQSYNSTIPFEITGDPKHPKAVAKVNYGGASYDLEIRQDEKLYKDIVGRFNTEQARIEALKQPLIDLLKDYAVLEGDSYSEYPNYTRPNTVRIVLLRDAASGNYAGESVLIDGMRGGASPLPNTTAQVTVIDDKPMLMVDCYNRQYQLSLDAATGKLTGGWFYQNNPNGYVAEVSILEAMDNAARQQKHAAQRKALASLSPSTPMIGLVNHRGTFLPQPGPVALALAVGADGKVTGTASFSQVLVVVDVQGQIADTIAGPQLELQFGGMREEGSIHSGNLANSLRNQRWSYRVADDGSAGPLSLTDGSLVLTAATDTYKADLHKQFVDAVTKGLTMQIRNPDYGPAEPKQVFKFTIDAEGKIIGAAQGAGKPFHPQSSATGELQDWNGMPMIVMQIADPPPAKQGAFWRTYTSPVLAMPTADGWYFTAPYWPDTNERSRQYFDMVEVRP